jgi:hypothetical protein
VSTIKASTLCRGNIAIHEFICSLIADFPVTVEVNEGTLKIRLIRDSVVEMKYSSKGFEFKVPIACKTLGVTGFAVFTTLFVEGHNRHKGPDEVLSVTNPNDISHFGSERGGQKMPVTLILD